MHTWYCICVHYWHIENNLKTALAGGLYANIVKIQPIAPDKRVRAKASNLLVVLIEPLSLK